MRSALVGVYNLIGWHNFTVPSCVKFYCLSLLSKWQKLTFRSLFSKLSVYGQYFSMVFRTRNYELGKFYEERNLHLQQNLKLCKFLFGRFNISCAVIETIIVRCTASFLRTPLDREWDYDNDTLIPALDSKFLVAAIRSRDLDSLRQLELLHGTS